MLRDRTSCQASLAFMARHLAAKAPVPTFRQISVRSEHREHCLALLTDLLLLNKCVAFSHFPSPTGKRVN